MILQYLVLKTPLFLFVIADSARGVAILAQHGAVGTKQT